MEPLITVVTFFIFLISLLLWAVIGLIYWIPMLFRATTTFAGRILQASLTHQNVDDLAQYLRVASGFYFDGFRRIKQALYGPEVSAPPKSRELFHGRFIIELLWTTGFWWAAHWIGQFDLLKPLTGRNPDVSESLQIVITSFAFSSLAILVLSVFLFAVEYLWLRVHEHEPKRHSESQSSHSSRDRSQNSFLTPDPELNLTDNPSEFMTDNYVTRLAANFKIHSREGDYLRFEDGSSDEPREGRHERTSN